jgi:hypothetical protein
MSISSDNVATPSSSRPAPLWWDRATPKPSSSTYHDATTSRIVGHRPAGALPWSRLGPYDRIPFGFYAGSAPLNVALPGHAGGASGAAAGAVVGEVLEEMGVLVDDRPRAFED